MTDHEDGDTVMIPAIMIDLLRGPPGLPGSSFGPAMYPSRDIDM
jgi:hypothetical protein